MANRRTSTASAATARVSLLPDIATGRASITSAMHVQGNCTSPPPPLVTLGLEGPDLQWQSPQCVIVTDHNAFWFFGKVWLDALYIRAKPSAFFYYTALIPVAGSNVYGSRLTLQGDGVWNTSAISAFPTASVYIQGVGNWSITRNLHVQCGHKLRMNPPHGNFCLFCCVGDACP